MFDPDVLDPSVKENGIDRYGLVIRFVTRCCVRSISIPFALEWIFLRVLPCTKTWPCTNTKPHSGKRVAVGDESIQYTFPSNRDEEKRRMVHSSSVKSLQRCAMKSFNSDEEKIQDLLSSLIDRIEKDVDSSRPAPESPLLLFNAASAVHRAVSTDTEFFSTSSLDGHDVLQSLDDYKHSVGVLFDEKDPPHLPARK